MSDQINPDKTWPAKILGVAGVLLAVGEVVWRIVFVVLIVGFIALAGRSIDLPSLVVHKIEDRLNAQMSGETLTLEKISFGLYDEKFRPTFDLTGVELLGQNGEGRLVLPRLRGKLDTSEMLQGRIALETIELYDAALELNRDQNGQISVVFASNIPEAARPQGSLGEVLTLIDDLFADPILRELEDIRTEDLTLDMFDARSNQHIVLNGGTLELINEETEIEFNLRFGLSIDGKDAAPIMFSARKEKGQAGAQIEAKFTDLNSRDLAKQVPPLNWLGILDAPVSGALTTVIGDDSKVARLAAALSISKGALRPADQAKPLPFESAQTYMRYDSATQRLLFDQILVDAPELRLSGSGYSDLMDFRRGIPQTLVGQLRFTNIKLDPEGVFETPVSFSEGILDMRYRPDELRMDIGQLVLRDQDTEVLAKGRVEITEQGWEAGIDAGIDRITFDGLMGLWPVSVSKNTRGWLSRNVKSGNVTDVAAAIRIEPGVRPEPALSFDFADATVRYIKAQPVIKNGRGYVSLQARRFVLALHSGQVTAPNGDLVDASGSVMDIADTRMRPGNANFNLQFHGPVQASLQLLDEKPFEFLKKADLKPDMARGYVRGNAILEFPLVKKLDFNQVEFDVTADLVDVASDTLIKDRLVQADLLYLSAENGRLAIGGPGRLDGVPIDAVWGQELGPGKGAKSAVTGVVELSQATLDTFNIELPKGSFSGQGQASFEMALERGKPPELNLTSDLKNIGLKIEAVGWSKPRSAKGELLADITLGEVPYVRKVSVNTAGLSTTGSVELRADRSFDRAIFSSFRIRNKLNSKVSIVAQGNNAPSLLVVEGGEIDIRKFEVNEGSGQGGPPLKLALDRVVVTDSIALHDFRANFSNDKGLKGDFYARINGGAAVRGTLLPTPKGLGILIVSDDGGSVLNSANIFTNARGGAMTLNLQPNGRPGEFNGFLEISDTRVKNAPALADLLAAISVIGLLEQLSGDGIAFSDVDAAFTLTPKGVTVSRSSAVGPSMGITMEGVYDPLARKLDMQGVISPVYAVNGLFGALFTPNQGEGLFGFNYTLKGPVGNANVRVNPLSILTPGMFREIFQKPPPTLKN